LPAGRHLLCGTASDKERPVLSPARAGHLWPYMGYLWPFMGYSCQIRPAEYH